ncbi:DUF1311 domain-containing protein [Achromobacter sp. GG226]|uniref:lysozyme inhibitor LprI family protein n=1 Tax=Verticiella alkaliphila TaxID=2779529 RepID=UPI001C0C7124|nr:lysozyme inhibitor LprI family protein [Verticiella sp. GG226]MBU4611383.1 DUF1311 domain-containing protein [Verticiella sp. GG226]
MSLRLATGFLLLSLSGVALSQHAFAASFDCARAATPTEQAICERPALAEQDRALAEVYARRLGLAKAGNAQTVDALRASQRAWLKTRDRCGRDADCLQASYTQRIAEFRNDIALVDRYVPDEVDRLAADDLRAAIEAHRRTDPESAVERALETLQIPAAGLTSFGPDASLEPTGVFGLPAQRPSGVTEDEWRALRASPIAVEAEGGNVGYTLVDLDGDGQRDLIIDAYVGGTGLFSYVSTWRRVGSRFQAAGGTRPGDDDDAYLYSLNGRGANQDATWIRLRGRTYAAYRVGYYGVDTIYLLRALQSVGEVPAVTVNYRYALELPRVQTREDGRAPVTLSERQHRELVKALPQVRRAQGPASGVSSEPLCPIPPGTPVDEHSAYLGMGPGHYTFEVVADFPVTLAGVCHVGRLMDWFGFYNAKAGGLEAQYQIARPGTDERATYTVRGRRSVTDVTTTVTRVEGDNGR